MAEMRTPEFTAKLDEGPVGFMTVLPGGGFNMGKSLIQWFVFSLAIGVFVGYIATLQLGQAAPAADVFRLTATVGVLGYGVSSMPDSTWQGLSWVTSFKFLVDGILYGLATGAAFAWFWPAG